MSLVRIVRERAEIIVAAEDDVDAIDVAEDMVEEMSDQIRWTADAPGEEEIEIIEAEEV